MASAREFKHFSHAHILELTSLQGRGMRNEKYCSGCMKPIEDLAYYCQPCNFFLHLTCSQIPQQITHPADLAHPLHLLHQPWNYALSPRGCNACWQPIPQGFFFHCSYCQLDLHPSCANLPKKIEDPNHHHNRKLELCYTPPYPSKAFTCNVCKKEDQRSWAYHCFGCDFDSHVNCTQIHSLRQSLLNKTSQAINLANVDYLARSFSPEPPRMFSSPRPSSLHNWSTFQMQQQQQYRPFQNPNNMMGNIVVRPAITAIFQTLLGSVVQSYMNPGGAGEDFLGGFNNSENLSGIMESMFDFGFF